MIRCLNRLLVSASALLLTAPALFAQAPAAAAAATEEQGMTLGKFLDGGGAVGWVIIVLSVVGMALVIDNFVNQRKQKLMPPDIADEVQALIEAGEYQEAMELCESNPGFFTNVVAAGLPKLNASFEAMEAAVKETMEEEQLKQLMRLGWLSLIAAVGPMLGLFGTVQGMIGAFQQIAATKGAADPASLADNISLALITTLDGLLVAIPITSAFVFLRNRLVTATLEVGAVVEDIFERFRPTKS